MRDVPGLPSGSILGYCTNVHAGATLTVATENLFQFAVNVKSKASPTKPLGVGLWLSAQAVHDFIRAIDYTLSWLKPRLEVEGLECFTLNGFPYQDFHGNSVKYRVYEPSWKSYNRLAYTECLIHILVLLSESRREASISTLPIGWNDLDCPNSLSSDHMIALLKILRAAEDRYRQLIHIDLEPEPGCVLQCSSHVVEYFKQHLVVRAQRHGAEEKRILRHIRVCHDICHAAVMFEDQAEMFARYKSAGIQIGKVQISNAIRVPFDEYSESDRREALQQLSAFAEDRYLHQTMIRFDDGRMQFFDDLPNAIQSVPDNQTARGEWRIHFHVPVYLESFGLLKTTRDHILECMRLLKNSEVKHWEVETYAWNVLPKDLQVPDLSKGIAKELLWVKEQAAKIA